MKTNDPGTITRRLFGCGSNVSMCMAFCEERLTGTVHKVNLVGLLGLIFSLPTSKAGASPVPQGKVSRVTDAKSKST